MGLPQCAAGCRGGNGELDRVRPAAVCGVGSGEGEVWLILVLQVNKKAPTPLRGGCGCNFTVRLCMLVYGVVQLGSGDYANKGKMPA